MENGSSVTVAVVIPVVGDAPYLAEAYASVVRQSRRPDEVVIVDDGLTVAGEARLHALLEAQPLLSGITKTVRGPRVGPASARNHGVRAASSSLVALLDDDDSWGPRKLELQCDAFDADPQVGLVGAHGEYMNSHSLPLGRYFGRPGRYPTHGSRSANPVARGELNPMITSTAVVRRDVWVAEGGMATELDAWFKGHAEDLDLWSRVAQRYSVVVLSASLARHRLRDGSLSAQGYWLQRDATRFVRFARSRGLRPPYGEAARNRFLASSASARRFSDWGGYWRGKASRHHASGRSFRKYGAVLVACVTDPRFVMARLGKGGRRRSEASNPWLDAASEPGSPVGSPDADTTA